NFSFLRGASKPEELVVAAKFLGFSSIGLADRNTVAGVVRAWQQAKVEGLSCHPGCRLVFCDGTPDVLAYPQDRKGWGHLCRMLTQANMRDDSEKGAPLLYRDDLFEWGDRMSLAILPDLSTPAEDHLRLISRLKDRFGKTLRLAVSPDYHGNDRYRIEQAAAMAEASGIPLMATNDVLYHTSERRRLQDVLTAIRLNVPVAEAGLELAANAERHLKPPMEMARLFRRHPQALAQTQHFAGELSFSLSDLQYNYPDEPTESGLGPQAELERLALEGAAIRYPSGVPADVTRRIREELALIERLNYARYFLTVYDIVKFARSQGILCQGRGSAANSVVCYCIGITEVGPERIDSLFERFISEERNEPPDIDVDFEHERREEVIQYIYSKYSAKRTA
ncbi:MAG: error-prone DNA polymerase, partial [Mesorhizobium sp.]